jgi:hypothetical protein
MKLPVNLVIPRQKLTDYLLVPRAVDDKSKFLAQGGFTQTNPHLLEAAIRKLAETAEAIYDQRTEYGDFYRVDGAISGPAQPLRVTTIWIIPTNDKEQCRFVTLKPLRR